MARGEAFFVIFPLLSIFSLFLGACPSPPSVSLYSIFVLYVCLFWVPGVLFYSWIDFYFFVYIFFSSIFFFRSYVQDCFRFFLFTLRHEDMSVYAFWMRKEGEKEE